MRRKTIILSLGLALLILTMAGLTLGILLKHEPNFYCSASVPESEERTLQSSEFVNRYSSLRNSVYNQYPDWWGVFTTEQMNAFFQHDFVRSFGGDNNLPDGFHDLRVQVDEGSLRVGCRYGTGFFSSVLSIDLKMWLVADQVNMIGLEITNLRAGALPLSRQIILDNITEAARRSNIEIKWFHRQGNPVAILGLQADQGVRPTIQIQRFELQMGKIVVVGRSTETHVSQSVAKPKMSDAPK